MARQRATKRSAKKPVKVPQTARAAHAMLTGTAPRKVDSAMLAGLQRRGDPGGKTLAAVRRHLEAGADPNELLSQGHVFMESLLHLAVQHHHLEIARYLLAHGADPNLTNGGPGETPLEAGEPLVSDAMTALLRSHGAR